MVHFISRVICGIVNMGVQLFMFVQVPTFSFPRFIKLLQFSCYSKYVLSGLVISMGGLQESLRKASITALMEYLQFSRTEKHGEREYALCTDIIWILEQYKRCDRVIIPTLKVHIIFSFKYILHIIFLFISTL